MKYLVIVESPAKISKIEKFLNTITQHTFIVDASYGHVRYFKNGLRSIDVANGFRPTYKIIKEKSNVIKKLRATQRLVDEVIIATDIDREGEAIGYHLIKALDLKVSTTRRMRFNQITKDALVDAFHTSQLLDMDMFYAQQARSILDILIGFKISPLLWKYFDKHLSAGRCQTPALKLIHDNHISRAAFTGTSSFKLSGYFNICAPDATKCEYVSKIISPGKAQSLIGELIRGEYRLTLRQKVARTISPPRPFITSTIQQDASVKFGFSPKYTMSILQKLYESGTITYMRTDSTYISEEFSNICEGYIKQHFIGLFHKRSSKNSKENAQEAHECIRPVVLDITPSDIADSVQRKLYTLIRNRTLAYYMKSNIEDVYTYALIHKTNSKEYFTYTKKITTRLGFKILFGTAEDDSAFISQLHTDKTYIPVNIEAAEQFTKPPALYTEASLVKQLEKLGIGRPSTFSNIINTLSERKYVEKGTRTASKIELKVFTVKRDESVVQGSNQVPALNTRGKLIITDLGICVIQYLLEHFSDTICSYTFTSLINDKLDLISKGGTPWNVVVGDVYTQFIEIVSAQTSVNTESAEENTQIGGVHNIQYSYNKDKYGYIFYATEGTTTRKCRAKRKTLKKSDITLGFVEEQFKYPIEKGTYLGEPVLIKLGPYGLYAQIGKVLFNVDTSDISLNDLIARYTVKQNNILHSWSNISVLNGTYGPYIRRGKKNIPIPKNCDVSSLTKAKCLDIIKGYKKRR
tara:strand:- start:1738 stop:3984 length:2247 start_codon:yes stop_codon:yes gene_type:complete